jgi:hypothetical protein
MDPIQKYTERLQRYTIDSNFRLLAAGALIVACALDFVPIVKKTFVDYRAWEITTQFFFVAVLGGLVALKYRNWENERAADRQREDKEREKRTVQRLELVDFFRSAVSLQHEYKKIRRTLRAMSFLDENKNRLIERQVFESLMEKLEDCQLKAEALQRQVAAQGDLFGLTKITDAVKLTSRNANVKADPEDVAYGIYDDEDADVKSDYCDSSDNFPKGTLANNIMKVVENDIKNIAQTKGCDIPRVIEKDSVIISNKLPETSVDSGAELAGDNSGAIIRDNLKKIEKYLRKLLFQYERRFVVRRMICPETPMIMSKRLKEFIESNGEDESSTISRNLLKPAELVRANILKLIENSTPSGKIE